MSVTGWGYAVTDNPVSPGQSRTTGNLGLGPLGRRLLLAFVIVALSSVAVLTVASLIGTSRGLSASAAEQRAAVAQAVAAAAGDAYAANGTWTGADLAPATAIATAAGARLVVRDNDFVVVSAPPEESTGKADEPNQKAESATPGRGGIAEPVVVAGTQVGTVRLGFGSPPASSGQQIAWTWILVAALISLVVAVAVSWFVARRISAPLTRLTAAVRSFAAGQRHVRSDPADRTAPGELGELARSFDATAEAVEVSELARQRMSADIAHELRTPLAALQAGLEELGDGLVAPEPERLQALHAQSVRLGRIVGDLAYLTAAETATLSMHRSAVDFSALVRAAVIEARPNLAHAGISVTANIQAGIEVDGDADRLHQIVGNLLANTARHCRSGDEVTVTASAPCDLGPGAQLTVADTGPGISESDLPHVFTRLWRGTADADDLGSGIGLAVVRELAAAHGGTVSVTSDGMSGTVFTVCLPMTRWG